MSANRVAGDAMAESLKDLLHYARNCGADAGMLDLATDALAAWAESGDASPHDAMAAELRRVTEERDKLRTALAPFAAFADPHRRMPATMVITAGSALARRQITMADCYAALDALGEPR